MEQTNELLRIEGVCAPLYMYKVPQHAELKTQILEAIDSMGVHSAVEERQSISNTDWFLPGDYPRPYINHVHTLFECYFSRLLAQEYSILPQVGFYPPQYWFQQYAKGDYHEWHVHGKSMFSNVYYVELPDGAARTSFFINGKEVSVAVEEGCILSFPTTLLHCSKPNQGARKTVVVANMSVI